MKPILQVRLHGITFEAEGISAFEFRPLQGEDAALPAFTAGAHIDIHLPNSLVRSYSIVSSQDERHRYVVAVNRDPSSRGGSVYMHDTLRVGDVVTISEPRNNFPLSEDAAYSVFIGGGIGITPLLCMIRRLESLGRSWHLHYGTRSRRKAAFLDELKVYGERVDARLHVKFDDEPGGTLMDVEGIIACSRPDAHFYCCGPVPMLEIFERATAGLPAERVHLEYFKAREAPAATGGFEVVLARAGKTLIVEPGKTILDSILDAGIPAAYSCLEGTCATCETAVLEGTPDHRDLVLSKKERESNAVMMICCSGSKSARLVLDL